MRRKLHMFAGVVGLCSLLALIVGCQAGEAKRRQLLVFPAPPDPPRIQFLTWASGAREVGSTNWDLDEFLLGDEGTDRRKLNKPYGLAVRDGSVYVCDSKGACVSRMDFKEERFSVLGVSGPGRLRKPLNIVIDPLGYKFVADAVRKQVVVFGPDDSYATAFSIPEPCHPVDVALYENELYVLDNDRSPQIVVLNRKNGEVIRSFGSEGREPGQLHIPGSIAIGPDGFLYVSDTMNWRIQKLTREGEPVWEKGIAGYQLGQFGRPRGIRIGPDGTVFVVDGATELVQMFNGDGELLMHFGGAGNTPGAMFLPASLAVDQGSIPYFQKYAHQKFTIEYLVFVANQYGSHLINVYGFGSFPEGFQLSNSEIATLPDVATGKGIGSVEGKELPDVSQKEAESPTHDGPS